MHKLLSVLILVGSCLLSVAYGKSSLTLDKVYFQISAKQWVSTQSALLTVTVNATLSNADLIKTRATIMSNLNKIAAGDWHITQFTRSQDSSGLEKLFVEAQLRLNQSSLTNSYQLAKDVSKPGAVYTINSIEFNPSLDDIQKVRAELREKLYQQALNELSSLNKTYADQHYTINRIYMMDSDAPPAVNYKAQEVRTMLMSTAPASAPLTVSNELIMSALVEAGSNRLKSGGSQRAVSNQ